MKALGYTHAKIPTQTTTWLACKIYLDFGFLPIPQNAVNSAGGWRIIKKAHGASGVKRVRLRGGRRGARRRALKKLRPPV